MSKSLILFAPFLAACLGDPFGLNPGTGTGTHAVTSSVQDGGALPEDPQPRPGPVSDTGQPGAQDAGGTTPAPAGPCSPQREPWVDALRIREIVLYQTVEIPLVQDGAWVQDRPVDVLQNKPALLRVFVDLLAAFVPHGVRGVLTLDHGGQHSEFADDLTPRVNSMESARESTFDFRIGAEQLTPDTRLSVRVVEPDCTRSSGQNAAARFPAAGEQPLQAAQIGALHVVIVPVRLDANVPDVNAGMLAALRQHLLAYYPVPDVVINAHQPLDWAQPVLADGTGWTELLNAVRRQRQRDNAARNVYYFGLVTPKDSFDAYCSDGCVLGLAPQNTFVSPPDQVGLGGGYEDPTTYITTVHELGHAHGLGHAPCVPPGGTIQGLDPNYPYSNGDIGSWGWDQRSDTLVPPSDKDVMGYCDPTWISEYNYGLIAERAKDVNLAERVVEKRAAVQTWSSLILYADGSARWGGFTTQEVPIGNASTARVLDAKGRELATVEVVRVALAHSDDSFLYIPEPQRGWWALEFEGKRIVLDQVAPAL